MNERVHLSIYPAGGWIDLVGAAALLSPLPSHRTLDSETEGKAWVSRLKDCVEAAIRMLYSVVQLDFTPEIEVCMVLDISLSIL